MILKKIIMLKVIHDNIIPKYFDNLIRIYYQDYVCMRVIHEARKAIDLR